MKRRNSSAVAVSGGRLRKAASFLTVRRWPRCIERKPPHVRVIEHGWRRGPIGFSLIGAAVLGLECFGPLDLKTERPPDLPRSVNAVTARNQLITMPQISILRREELTAAAHAS